MLILIGHLINRCKVQNVDAHFLMNSTSSDFFGSVRMLAVKRLG